MKTWQHWALVLGATIALSGCFQIKTQADFNRDGSASFTSAVDMSGLYAMMREMGAGKDDQKPLNCAEIKKDLPKEFTCKDVKEGAFEYSGKLSAAEVTGLKRDGMTWELDVVKFFQGMNKAAEAPLGDKADKKLEAGQAAMMRSMGMVLDLELKVPGTILTVNGKAHTGNANSVKVDLMECLTQDQCLVTMRVVPLWMYAAGLGAAGVVLLLILVLLLRRRKPALASAAE